MPLIVHFLLRSVIVRFKFRNTENVQASPLAIAIKNPPAGAGDRRDAGSILVWGRSSGGGHGNPATSRILAYRIPRTEEPRRLQSTKSQRVRHD